MFCIEHICLDWSIIFGMVCPLSIFWLIWPFSVVPHICSRGSHEQDLWFFLLLVCKMICRSRVQTPDFTAQSFVGPGLWFPGLTTCFRPLESLAYVNITIPYYKQKRWCTWWWHHFNIFQKIIIRHPKDPIHLSEKYAPFDLLYNEHAPNITIIF